MAAELFNESIAVYGANCAGFAERALAEEPTARAAMARTLREVAVEYTKSGQPGGCMVISAGLNTTNTEVAAAQEQMRTANADAFAARIRTDIDAGLLPTDTDAAVLARYIGTIMQGMSQGARDGARRSELQQVAELALRTWPEDTPLDR
ncbi:TetR/AcrR family transcriptional regulator [Nocardia sp. NBC_01388]|uniref:TetR/AcrR family transcriptional regulator n=1 Tax=Nocardia sp. NBC_01388 TaxID=2903596 RepID=UPI003244257D